MNKLVFNRACFFGENSINVLADEIANRHFKKAFIVTDNGLIDCFNKKQNSFSFVFRYHTRTNR